MIETEKAHFASATIASHESTVKYGDLAIKSLLLLTGGAPVARRTKIG
jgi:hypothetical protein